MEQTSYQPLSDSLSIAVNLTHRFSTDSILLSDFAAPKKSEHACDLCSGCGIIALSWYRQGAQLGPKLAVGVELEPQASALMELSIQQNQLAHQVVAINMDLKEISPNCHPALKLQSFDVVTCNPPYQTQGSGLVAGSQRGVARHELECTIEDVCQAASKLLRFGGRLCICQRPSRLVDVLAAMRSLGIEPKRLRMVQKNADTPPWLFMVEGKKGSKPHMVIDPPVILYHPDGSLTQQAKEIYRYT